MILDFVFPVEHKSMLIGNNVKFDNISDLLKIVSPFYTNLSVNSTLYRILESIKTKANIAMKWGNNFHCLYRNDTAELGTILKILTEYML